MRAIMIEPLPARKSYGDATLTKPRDHPGVFLLELHRGKDNKISADFWLQSVSGRRRATGHDLDERADQSASPRCRARSHRCPSRSPQSRSDILRRVDCAQGAKRLCSRHLRLTADESLLQLRLRARRRPHHRRLLPACESSLHSLLLALSALQMSFDRSSHTSSPFPYRPSARSTGMLTRRDACSPWCTIIAS
jgi:hypothetical protein